MFKSTSGCWIWCWACFAKNDWKPELLLLSEEALGDGNKLSHARASNAAGHVVNSEKFLDSHVFSADRAALLAFQEGPSAQTGANSLRFVSAERGSIVLNFLHGYTAKKWQVSGQNDADLVIHRNDILVDVEFGGKLADSVSGSAFHRVHGYSKRYFGPYPQYWNYNFLISNNLGGALSTFSGAHLAGFRRW